MTTPSFDTLLAMISDRSAALSSAAAEANLAARVPACPDWSLRDLVAHLGEVQRSWAATVAAGPAPGPPDESQVTGIERGDDLLTWFSASTDALTAALRTSGPDRGCWTWWESSGAPMTAGAVARHQVHEAAVHARDAQDAVGRPEPLPPDVAVDAVAEFLTVGLGSSGPWPHDPAIVGLDAGESGQWVVGLGSAGAALRDTLRPAGPEPGAWLRGSASDLALVLFRRLDLDSIRVDGDRVLGQRLVSWPDLD